MIDIENGNNHNNDRRSVVLFSFIEIVVCKVYLDDRVVQYLLP